MLNISPFHSGLSNLTKRGMILAHPNQFEQTLFKVIKEQLSSRNLAYFTQLYNIYVKSI